RQAASVFPSTTPTQAFRRERQRFDTEGSHQAGFSVPRRAEGVLGLPELAPSLAGPIPALVQRVLDSSTEPPCGSMSHRPLRTVAPAGFQETSGYLHGLLWRLRRRSTISTGFWRSCTPSRGISMSFSPSPRRSQPFLSPPSL